MTRVLSALLGAQEPRFQQSLQNLEKLTGHPGADIRLSTEIQQRTRETLRALHLDEHDTTGRELHAALGRRLQDDEANLRRALLEGSNTSQDGSNTDALVIAQLALRLKDVTSPSSCFALKSASAKRMLRANLPRKTMKLLGYRSADSMLKHETAASLYAASCVVESNAWSKRMLAGYSKLTPADFEQREIIIEHPSSARWMDIAGAASGAGVLPVMAFKELGAVVLLPFEQTHSAFPVLTAAVFAVHGINEVRAAGTYLKLHQVQPQFGAIVQKIIESDAAVTQLGTGEKLSWHNVHQYCARVGSAVRSDLFEPLVNLEEMVWTPVEQALAALEPSCDFWKNLAHVGMLDSGKAVSCNLSDVLTSHASRTRFEDRAGHYFEQALRSELLLRYLAHGKLEQKVFASLQPALVPEMAEV